MRFYSTNNVKHTATFKDAVLRGLAPDNGLYMPEAIIRLPASVLAQASNMSLPALSFEAAKVLIGKSVPEKVLKAIVDEAINFDAPLKQLSDSTYVLELFHGPTLAFKDFGARFLSAVTRFLLWGSERELCVLVATSGDTGSAVASAFLGYPNVRVVLLYPSGKVSHIQEMQLTTMGGNVSALEVEGTFDDCQRMVKSAFLDQELNKLAFLTSANSINIARLIPQTFYYLKAAFELMKRGKPAVFSVPSGNFGNLTAGVIAKNLGAPIPHFVAATNANDVVPEYIRTGAFKPRPSVTTISNAMDVGNPSNFARLLELYGKSHERVRSEIFGCAVNDDQTRECIRRTFENHGYIIDPHGAVALLGLESYMFQNKSDVAGVALGTAHPAKFGDVVRQSCGQDVNLPESLQKHLKAEKQSVRIPATFEALVDYLRASIAGNHPS